ncbi:hypothetical protein GH714_028293 [Hevea brasiliensis]|uniref:CN hydrolase domain-containing protein n=1 Tax=Hevea brasiliensis TaxID=3981 RepID=A0A6A6N306_HEVBR|nr:hypothetical protein GH714_028293 [Hevea brasiliensis]
MLGSFSAADFFPYVGWIVDRLTGLHARLERNFQEFDVFYQKVIDDHIQKGTKEPGQEDIIDVLLRLERFQTESGTIQFSEDHIKAILMEAWMVPFAFCAKEKRCLLKIAVNICYGRHHPLNWLAFGLNGAEIVFNPSATVGELSEPMWPIEACNAAIANSYFLGLSIVLGLRISPIHSLRVMGSHNIQILGIYGSSHFSAPDASCRPSLSRYKDGLLISEMDLNLCRQLKDKWGFRMTARYKLYADVLAHYLKPDFERKSSLTHCYTKSHPSPRYYANL